MTEKQFQISPLSRAFEIRKDSINVESLEVDVTFSTGAEVLRQPWFEEPFVEELSLDPSHVRMDRLKNNAPFLNSHRAYTLGDVIGVVRQADVDGKSGSAKIKFSEREDVKPIFNDVKNGILTKTSVGYRVYQYQDVTKPTDKYRRLRAVDWEPFEISLVAVAADDKAVVRSESVEKNACEILSTRSEENTMTVPIKKEEPKAEAAATNLDEVRSQASIECSKRAVEIMDSCKKAGLPNDFVRELIADASLPISEVRAKIIDKIAEQKEKDKDIDPTHVTLGEDVSRRSFKEGCVEAILHRKRPDQNKLSEVGQKFRRMKLMDMLRFHAEKIQGKDAWSLSPDELIRAAFHSTSDFPDVLANVANKSLMQGYKYAGQTFEPFVTRVPVPDFKQVSRLKLGEAPALEKINEGGEFTYGTIGESKEVYQLLTYGKKVKVTRQVIINDDINAFTDVPYKFGVSASMKESDLVYAQGFTANPTMGDGVALFHSNHSNYTASGTVIDVGSIGIGKTAMATQKGLDGSTPLNLLPTILLVPVAKETVAAQYVVDIQGSTLNASQSSNRNPYIGKLTLISEPRLDVASANSWYLLASKDQIDIIELGYLEGQESGPVLIQEEITGEGVVLGAFFDRCAKAMDHRGFYKNVGA